MKWIKWKQFIRTFPSAYNRKGSALVITMTMLTMIFLFFISFAMIAFYSQRNAKLSESIIQARLFLQTGLEKVYEDLALRWAQPTFENLYPATNRNQPNFFVPTTGPWSDRFYWATTGNQNEGLWDAFYVSFAGIDFTPKPSLGGLDNSIGWINYLDDNGLLVARIAYLVIDESGKIDPSWVVDTGTSEGNEVRNFLNPVDINLTGLFSTSFAQKFQPIGNGIGLMPDTAQWFSYDHILRTIPEAVTNYKEVISNTIFPHSIDYEAFSVYRTFGGRTVAVTKHRFDLKNCDWDSFNNRIDQPNSQGIILDTDAADFWVNNTIGPNNGGIPWFHFAKDETIKKQVLANLIDYCDSDSIATTDNPDAPTFVGLEKVPYINEIYFDAQIVWDGSNWYLRLRVYPELINCYEVPLGINGRLQLRVEISATSGLENVSSTGPWDLNYVLSSNIPARSIALFPPNVQLLSLGWGNWNQGKDKTVNGFQVTIHSAKLTDNDGNLWDFAFDRSTTCTAMGTIDQLTLKTMSIEVNDPRANLSSSEWTWSSSWSTGINGSPGNVNTVCWPIGPMCDLETYAVPGAMNSPPDNTVYPFALDRSTTPWRGISTMYIRNGPPETLWELGAIHRGVAWQTLNLTVFNAAATTVGNAGMDTYNAGDANLLDQVKLTSDVLSVGKVNINTPHFKVLRALLLGLPIGTIYEDPNGTRYDTVVARKITATDAQKIIQSGTSPVTGEWLFHNGSTGWKSGTGDVGGDPFYNRGQLAYVQRLWDGTAYTPDNTTDDYHQDTDMACEEIIGKIAHLCTTRPNYFTVIVVAQVIKDLPALGGAAGIYDSSVDRILAQQRMMAIFHRDAFTNKFQVLRLEYLDD